MGFLDYCLGKLGYVKKNTQSNTAANTAEDQRGYINRITQSRTMKMADAPRNRRVEEDNTTVFSSLVDSLLGELGYIKESTQLKEVVITTPTLIEHPREIHHVGNTPLREIHHVGNTPLREIHHVGNTPQSTVIAAARGVQCVENNRDSLGCINQTTQSRTAVNVKQPLMGDAMDNHYVENVLDKLRDIDRITQSKKPGLEKFLQAVREQLQFIDCPIMNGCVLSYTGSSYESTAVRKGTDYDIILILPRPSLGDDLEVLKSRVPGYYKLKWTPNEYDDYGQDECGNYGHYNEYGTYGTAGTYKVNWLDFINDENMLETKMLLQYVFRKFGDILENIRAFHPTWQVSYHVQFSTLVSFFRNENGEKIKVDFVPQIGYSNWEDLPNLCSVRELPAPLQYCVKGSGLQYPIFFSLVPAPHMQRFADGNYLVTTSFAMLEKYCMKASETVKDAVLLVKLLSQFHGWKRNFGLRPFHMKRVAIKHYDELNGLSSWNAFKRLLLYLSLDLHQGKIDGFFIKNQDVYQKRMEVCNKLAVQMDIAMTNVQPSNLKNCLINTN